MVYICIDNMVYRCFMMFHEFSWCFMNFHEGLWFVQFWQMICHTLKSPQNHDFSTLSSQLLNLPPPQIQNTPWVFFIVGGVALGVTPVTPNKTSKTKKKCFQPLPLNILIKIYSKMEKNECCKDTPKNEKHQIKTTPRSFSTFCFQIPDWNLFKKCKKRLQEGNLYEYIQDHN